jgi:DNA-binding NarL/FixJ family response regulator
VPFQSANDPSDTGILLIWLIESRRLECECILHALQAAAPSTEVLCFTRCEDIGAGSRRRPSKPDLVILGIGVCRLSDPRVQSELENLASIAPQSPILILSSRGDADGAAIEEAQHAIALGARGYFSASLTIEMLAAAIRLIGAGGIFLPPSVVTTAMQIPRRSTGNGQSG